MRVVAIVAALVVSGCFIEIDELRGATTATGAGGAGAGAGGGAGGESCTTECPAGTECAAGRCHVVSPPQSCGEAIDVTQGGLFVWSGDDKPPFLNVPCGDASDPLLVIGAGQSNSGHGFTLLLDGPGYAIASPCQEGGTCCSAAELANGDFVVHLPDGEDAKFFPTAEPAGPIVFEVREQLEAPSFTCGS